MTQEEKSYINKLKEELNNIYCIVFEGTTPNAGSASQVILDLQEERDQLKTTISHFNSRHAKLMQVCTNLHNAFVNMEHSPTCASLRLSCPVCGGPPFCYCPAYYRGVKLQAHPCNCWKRDLTPIKTYDTL